MVYVHSLSIVKNQRDAYSVCTKLSYIYNDEWILSLPVAFLYGNQTHRRRTANLIAEDLALQSNTMLSRDNVIALHAVFRD